MIFNEKTFMHDAVRILVTGGAGFIGSHLVDKLLKKSFNVVVLDNLSSGKEKFIKHNFNNPKFEFQKLDLLTDQIDSCFKDIDEVWHFAANPNVREYDGKIYLEQIVMAKNILEAMRRNDIKRILFASSSTVYGEAISSDAPVPTPEDHPTNPISLYGAAKLACESLIQAYCNIHNFRAWIFRLANIVGSRSTHGVIYDFIDKLKRNSNGLEILGNGNQRKSYLYIDDCIEAMFLAREKTEEKINILNVGSKDWTTVHEIAEIVYNAMKAEPNLKFTGGERGWKGDVPLMLLNNEKIKQLGFTPEHDSRGAIKKVMDMRIRE